MPIQVDGFLLQDSPKIYVARVPGRWLIKHATPSWRVDDPEKGFQRIVNEKRAVQIARTVLDGGRTFPNAIVLATDRETVTCDKGKVTLPDRIKFLVVDGQHRLWAQNFSIFEAEYTCLIHFGLSEEEMASLH